MDALQQQLATMRQSLFDEGNLDDLFVQLEGFDDDDEPNFVEETISSYFSDSQSKYIDSIDKQLDAVQVDFAKLHTSISMFKGSSSSVGAKKVTAEINRLLEHCLAKDMEGCNAAFQRVKEEFNIVKDRLEAYLQLRQQARTANATNGPN